MDKISFSGKLHFLQNQTDLICAACGKKMLFESDIKLIRRAVEPLKGDELAQRLGIYIDYFGERCNSENLRQLVQLAQEQKHASDGIKTLSLFLKDGKIHSSDINTLLHNLFSPVLYSADHVIPHSKGGANTYANFVPMHRSCNTDRSCVSYSDLVKSEPSILENLKKAISLIQSRIQSDKAGLTNYKINIPEDYGQKITEAFASQGIDRKLLTFA